jgi:hypothetical protein
VSTSYTQMASAVFPSRLWLSSQLGQDGVFGLNVEHLRIRLLRQILTCLSEWRNTPSDTTDTLHLMALTIVV